MNDKTIKAIDTLVNSTPEYVDIPINAFDENRLFNVAKAVIETGDALSDVNDYLREKMTGKDFDNPEKFIEYSKTVIYAIVKFNEYQQH